MCPHLFELYSCIPKKSETIFRIPMNPLISFTVSLTTKLSKYFTLLLLTQISSH